MDESEILDKIQTTTETDSDGEETFPVTPTTRVRPPTPGGLVFLEELKGLEPREAELRKLRLFDAMQRDVFNMADFLGQDPRQTMDEIMAALQGQPLSTWTSRRRAGVTLHYVPSAHLQKLAGELLSTVELLHGKLTAYLTDPDSKIRPDFMVNAISRLLDKIIVIRGVASKGLESDDQSSVSAQQLDATLKKIEDLNRKLEASSKVE